MGEQVITPSTCDCGKCPPESWWVAKWHRDRPFWRGPLSNGDEIVADWHLELERRAAQERKRQQDIIEALPSRAAILVADLDDDGRFRDTPAVVALRAWYDEVLDERPIVILSGPPGVGKTVAACWLAYAKGLHAPVFVTAAAYARMSKFGKEREELVHEAHMVILDDLGAEYVDKSGSWLADFDELIDRLYREETTTIITTNCTAKQFRARYGARVVDRLAECGHWITVTGKSLRGQGR